MTAVIQHRKYPVIKHDLKQQIMNNLKTFGLMTILTLLLMGQR